MRPFLISLSVVAIACSGTEATDPQLKPEPLPVSSIAAEIPLSMAIGTSATIKVSLRDTNGQQVSRPVTFGSSDSSVATVDPSGVIRAFREGSASITVLSEGKTAEGIVHAVGPSSTSCLSAFDLCVLGVYDLVSINGQLLPVKSPWGVGEWDYDSDAGTWLLTQASLTLYRDGNFMLSMTHRAASGTAVYWGVPGRYAAKDGLYLLTVNNDSREARSVADTLTVEWETGWTFAFKRRVTS